MRVSLLLAVLSDSTSEQQVAQPSHSLNKLCLTSYALIHRITARVKKLDFFAHLHGVLVLD